MDSELKNLMSQIELEQNLVSLKEILPQCMDFQDTFAKFMYNYYSSLCKEGFTKSQALEIIKTHGTGLNNTV